MSIKIKISGVFLEEDGASHPIENEGDVKKLIAFGQQCLSLLQGGTSVTFGSFQQVSARPVQPNSVQPKIEDRFNAQQVKSPLSPTLSDKRFANPVKAEIQRVLDSGSNPPRKGNPEFGERGIDYFIRSFVRLNAMKGSGIYITFSQVCLDMLKQGMGIRSDTADKAISSVRSMVRESGVEALIEKEGEGMCLTQLPDWSKPAIAKSETTVHEASMEFGHQGHSNGQYDLIGDDDV